MACHTSLVLLQDDPPVVVTDADGNETLVPSNNSERETLRAQDAYQFPLIGSVSLFSLYCAFKFFDKDIVNLLIGGYFGIIGTFAVTVTLAPLFMTISPLACLVNDITWEHKISHPFGKSKLLGSPPSPFQFTIVFCIMEIVAAFAALGIITLYYYHGKPWYINNILGISFCIQGIQRFSLGTYKIGMILLIGLFFYDIFWVFGTDVMVTVAKNLDGPIKILLPRTLDADPETGKLKDLSLLGLGDIVIPGFFLALLLRFDAHQFMTKHNKHSENAATTNTTTATETTLSTTTTTTEKFVVDVHDPFPKPYFHTALIAYIGGLGFTIFIMMYFNAAQPALLYLVPACLGSSLLTALVRGELKDLFDYSEEVDDDDIVEVPQTDDVADGESKKEQ
jgi:minor histocompatibility antigen H13